MASPEPQQERGDNRKSLNTHDGEKKSGPVSFSFSKTLNKAKTGKTEERDYLIEVEGKELKSTKPVDKPKEIIIPLIQKNRWYRQEEATQRVTEGDQRNSGSQDQDSVESQAVKELLEESRKQQERWLNGPQTDPSLAIPLVMQNQVPQGFEDGERVRVDLRPESSTEADYERVPVEAYGLAMLKGMGWKEGEGIGRTFKQDVKPIEHQLRPKGLGLGADRSAIKDLEPTRPKRPPKPGDERGKEEEALVMGPGGCVLIQSGAHKELYAKIEGVDADNARVVVKLAIGGKAVTISQHAVRLIPQKEYDKYSKDLSRLSKAHKEKEREREKESEREKARRREEPEARLDGRDERAKDRPSAREHGQRKRKQQDSSADGEKPPPVKEYRASPSALSWLQRDLRVRFIDKAFKGGKYYNSKMRVEDVLTPDICVCRTDEGRLLDDVRQAMLETIVPKGDTDSVMVVLGEHRGQVGRILKRDKEKCRAMVELDRYEERVFTLDYDSICHYVGGDS
ncbi:G-patch domain and KOW motifs-containing protein [Electrophorus electricus]|uniref:G-patch domain and KOW motifs-containing protein n=1 Tax=Electrophorus electricus TaxID=8005 RepID=A0A4W4DYF9_ELEEL|nr:G-patch domain and KOW motifs-containing protein [Electrophorus electricus]